MIPQEHHDSRSISDRSGGESHTISHNTNVSDTDLHDDVNTDQENQENAYQEEIDDVNIDQENQENTYQEEIDVVGTSPHSAPIGSNSRSHRSNDFILYSPHETNLISYLLLFHIPKPSTEENFLLFSVHVCTKSTSCIEEKSLCTYIHLKFSSLLPGTYIF